jgi:hypothetical protein
MPVNPYTIPFRNDSGVEIPPYAIMRPKQTVDTGTEVIDRDGQWCIAVVKPDTVFARRYLINGPTAIPIDGYGMASDGSYPTLALRENEAGSGAGEGYGVQPSSWKLKWYSPGGFSFHAESGQAASGDYRGLFSQSECTKLIVQGTATLIGGGTYGITANVMRDHHPSLVETTMQVLIRDVQFPGGEVYPDNTIYGVSWRNGFWVIDWFTVCPA